ncbi:urea carboxylase [Hyphomicrobium sp. LHD-15]|uniref:urea carboxylase n=1 Tax=Hyphomicrobium sp. LHD-15 TaxID=3072142 RepID=UPI0028100F8D|nr:urea carboxylase [Hyphomicrobium sp. LHD-15]MDQ8697324.1 urea carboxylase [Hyphomicrobium sp. LHD-15]
MFKKVLIANRGAIACRIIRTLDRLGVASVAVYSEADRHSMHVAQAREAVAIGPSAAAQSYLKVDAILAAAKATGAEAIHPGYGFLSENPDFADACAAAGIAFIGPKPDQMRAFGLKHRARELALAAGVPLAPGSGLIDNLDAAKAEAQRIGYPVMLKSTAGGGGIGLQLVSSETELEPLYERVERLARNNFKDPGLFLEKYVSRGRHIEVQIFGDGKGRVVALGERDCSAQRRNQKVIEETPAPGLSDKARAALWKTACDLGKSVSYESAGTVEFLYDSDTDAFYFLEVNTRLQVEHGVTEEVTGFDLVEWMVRQAAGETLPLEQERIQPKGASIQVRLYAEDPGRDFRPSSGQLSHVAWPADARVETWVESGADVSPFYDPMLAKIIVKAETRPQALAKLQDALAATEIGGLETNLDYLRQLAASDILAEGQMLTRTLATFPYKAATVEVLASGTQTTIQDWPGRTGYWAVGVPPSGPMDHLSFRLANRLLGNAEGAPALELTLSGPTLQFNRDSVICLAGAEMSARVGDRAVPFWQPFQVAAGEVLKIGSVTGAGARAYLAIQGGFDVPLYLGSHATFTLGKFGGHGGRALLTGDVLHISRAAPSESAAPASLPDALRPVLSRAWEIGVLYGPHGSPDFFTDDDIATFFAANWEVHYNSNRTGVRLIGPKPTWARTDGGEAGLHPSNIHDNAYAIGAVDFTGDMPVILGPDGPSLGGFVCPVTIVQAELWKLGQLRPGDKVQFKRLSPVNARALEIKQDSEIASLAPMGSPPLVDVNSVGADDCIVGDHPEDGVLPRVVYRRQGDKYLLVEYGPIVLDFELRFRAHVLMTKLETLAIPGIIDLTPGIRSLQIHYDSRVLPLQALVDKLAEIEDAMGDIGDIEVPSRIVHMPLSWDDAATQLAISKYMQSVRADAPWCPSNIEFIRRINGLDSIEDVKEIAYGASYLVLGLGDVYLGAPVATPLDPRHRLVTTKYNPARTWTPENAVGIGGAYMCVYGMEGPGGYQFIGRTAQVWNTHRITPEFDADKPWLLRFFDQIRFYPMDAEELLAFRDGFLQGKVGLKIEPTTFKLSDYRQFLTDNAADIAAFKKKQQAAFEDERSRWQASDQSGAATSEASADDGAEDALADNAVPVASPVPGAVWKVEVSKGARVKEGDLLVVVESMKMEMSVHAPSSGVVTEVRCAEGRPVALGQTLIVLTEDVPETAA